LNEDFERRANEFLEGYYRQLSGPAAAAEAIYHASRLDCKRGITEWVKAFDLAFWSSDYSLCRALLAVRGAFGTLGPLESGMVARCEADFCRIQALYADSERHYKSGVKYFERAQREENTVELQKCKALLLLNFGGLHAIRSQLSACAKNYQDVIDICECALGRAVDDVELNYLMAEGHLGLGNVKQWESKTTSASESYSAAVRICDHALQTIGSQSFDGLLNVRVVDLLNDKAFGLAGIGEVEAGVYEHEEAILNYRRAEVCYDDALKLEVDLVVQNDKAYNSTSIAESEIALSHYEAACENCNRALSVYNEILQRAPDDIIYHANRSRALRIYGVSLARLLRYEEALKRCGEAVDACGEALRLVPADTWALCNRALALLSRGQIFFESGNYVAALGSFTQSLEAFDRMLVQAPDDAEALAGKGRVLFNQGEVLSRTLSSEAAIEAYQHSVATLDRVLEDAAEDVEARRDKARALQGLGEALLAVARRSDALEALSYALTEYSHALDLAPRHQPLRESRDRLAASLGDLRASRQ
jgi:tetratricopeptide (TPR) repeat protein